MYALHAQKVCVYGRPMPEVDNFILNQLIEADVAPHLDPFSFFTSIYHDRMLLKITVCACKDGLIDKKGRQSYFLFTSVSLQSVNRLVATIMNHFKRVF